MHLFYLLFFFILIIGIFFFPFLIMWWIEHDIHKKPVKKYDYQLYRQIEIVLRRTQTKERVVTQLTQLLEQHGYRLSRQTEKLVIFRPGSFFSRKSTIRINISRYPNARERFEALRLHAESTIGLLTKIAKSDGKVSKAEAGLITRSINRYVTMAKQLGSDTATLQTFRAYLIDVHKEAKEGQRTALSYAKLLHSSPQHTKIQLLQQMVKLAIIDSFTSDKEQLIFEAGLAMGIEERYLRQFVGNRYRQNSGQQQRRRYNSSKNTQRTNNYIPEHYHILGCNPQDEVNTIKKKYRALVKKYHPDFTHSTDETSKAQLLQKMQEINFAYEKIKREKKF